MTTSAQDTTTVAQVAHDAPDAAVLAEARREAMVAAHAARAGYWPSCAGAPPARRRRRKAS
jgi:hypothetical protein